MRLPCFVLIFVAIVTADPPYEDYLTGNPKDVVTRTRPGFALVGGGKDLEAVSRWLIDRSGGGNFVVVRASGSDGYNKFLYDNGGLSSVRSLVLKTQVAAQDATAAARIREAEALFIAGGDQWNYVRLWRAAPVGQALQSLIDRGVPFGGTSAGLAVLGQYAFSAEHDSVTSAQALQNPYDERVTLVKDFLRIPILQQTITDSHFKARDRMGRSLVFLARILKDHHEPEARAIAIDEQTAALLEPTGQIAIEGVGSVYFLRAHGVPAGCESGRPLNLKDVSVYRVGRGGRFDLHAWKGSGGTPYELSVNEGSVASTQPGGSVY